MHSVRPMGNAYVAAGNVINFSSAQDTPNRTTLIVSPPEITKAKTQVPKAEIGKPSSNDTLLLSKQNSIIPLPACSTAGEVWQDRAGNGDIWGVGTNGNMENIQIHQISLKSRVVLESLRARMLSQCLCGTKTPDSAHIVHEVQIRDKNGEMQRVRTLINCGATSIFMAPRFSKRLRISHEAVHITTIGLDGAVMQHAKDSRKMRIAVQYLDYLAADNESDVLVVPMHTYDLVLGVPWFHKRHPDTNWAYHRLTSLQSWSASGVEEMTPMTMAVGSMVSEAENDKLLRGLVVTVSPRMEPSPTVRSLPSGLCEAVAVMKASSRRVSSTASNATAPCLLRTALGLYYLVNPSWCLPKSLPAVLCIPQSVGDVLRWPHR